MTLDKAIEWVKELKVVVNTNESDAKIMVIQALEELQKFKAIGLTPELIEAMQGHNVALINQVEEIRIKTIDECINDIRKYADSAYDWNMDDKTDDGNVGYIEEGLYEAVERLQMLKSEESECSEEENNDDIIKRLRIKMIEKFANALKSKCDIAIDSKMNKDTYPSLSDAYEYFKDDIDEVTNELKAIDSEDSEEKDTDCIIKHLTRECSYNETGCSGCKGKERIKIALEKSEAKKPVDVTRVKDGDNFVGYIGKCPHCGAIVDENDNVSYCDCGQKLAWSEVY